MSQEPQPIPLPKPPAPLPASARIVRVLEAIPARAYALLLAAIVSVIAYLEVLKPEVVVIVAVFLAFLPGVIRRHLVHQVMGMLCVGIVGMLAMQYLNPLALAHPTVHLLQFFLVFGLLSVGEVLLSCKRSRRAVLLALLAAMAAAGIFLTLQQYISFSEASLTLSIRPHGPISLDRISMPALIILVPWMLIPIAVRGAGGGRSRLIVLSLLAVAGLAMYLVFSLSVVYGLARDTLEGHGPFGARTAVQRLAQRGQAEDFEAIWQAVETKWDTLPNALGALPMEDWRWAAVEALGRHDHKAAAERFSAILREEPRQLLAEMVATLMAKENRFETAPLLMRYALLGARESRGVDCTDSLEAMGVPQSALVVLVSSQVGQKPQGGLEDLKLSARTVERLKKILGDNAGDTYAAWQKAYDERVDKLPSPLSAQEKQELQRELWCFVAYNQAAGQLMIARSGLARARLIVDGKGDLMQKLGSGARLSAEESVAMGNYLQQATADINPPRPNWDVPTADALGNEIVQYHNRIAELIQQVVMPAMRAAGMATTAPASMPASAPATRPAPASNAAGK